jgi:glycosyltransferase involved in cell wall biosynthesis
MRKLRVGVWIYDNYKPEMGGGFGYYNQLINALGNYNFKDAEIVFISYSNTIVDFPFNNYYSIKTKKYDYNPLSLKQRLINKVANKFGIRIFGITDKAYLENQDDLKKELYQIIDVLYYLQPTCELHNFPYIYTLWDLGHLSSYAFPEVTMNNCFEYRKSHHELYPYKAIKIFSESETGKNDIVKYLSINEERIDVIPIFPSEIVHDNCNSKKPIQMEEDDFFIHYPAQFWAHKNHYSLVIAFKQISIIYPNLKLVFTGADKGNKSYILRLIKELNIKDNVIYLGFIDIEELKWLYLNSQGLVMPTFLGPTNMPLLEAAELGCPVACSDLEGHKEQLGNYGYYFNPQNTNSISSSIKEMIEDNKKGIIKEYNSKFNIENALIQIDKSFSEVKNIRFCWGDNDKIF